MSDPTAAPAPHPTTSHAETEKRPRGRARPPVDTSRVKSAPSRALESPAVDVSPLGARPAKATKWAIQRNVHGQWQDLSFAPPGSPVELFEWPIADLSAEEVARRWGPGEYRTIWIGSNGTGGRVVVGPGRRILVPAHARPAAAEAAPSPALPAGLEGALALAGILEQQSTAKLAGVVQVAQILAGANGGSSPMLEMMRMMMQQQDARHKETLALMTGQIQSLERRLDSQYEDDAPEASPAAGAAAVAGELVKRAVPLIKAPKDGGLLEQLKVALVNAAIEHPKEGLEVVNQIAGVAKNVSAALGGGPRPRARAPQHGPAIVTIPAAPAPPPPPAKAEPFSPNPPSPQPKGATLPSPS